MAECWMAATSLKKGSIAGAFRWIWPPPGDFFWNWIVYLEMCMTIRSMDIRVLVNYPLSWITSER